ncbi:hypothetical protein [Nannocystis pusilla]|uniref:hypothetical protein n=1 Tax=Nannocystis pusilla TaxID=889268 RepID=UPI003B7B7364
MRPDLRLRPCAAACANDSGSISVLAASERSGSDSAPGTSILSASGCTSFEYLSEPELSGGVVPGRGRVQSICVLLPAEVLADESTLAAGRDCVGVTASGSSGGKSEPRRGVVAFERAGLGDPDGSSGGRRAHAGSETRWGAPGSVTPAPPGTARRARVAASEMRWGAPGRTTPAPV